MHVRVRMTDTAPSLLKDVMKGIPSRSAMGALASKGNILMAQRTREGKSESGQPFGPYKTEKYYAPVENRSPGYPEPTGGTPSKTGKTMKYDSYAAYKSAMGFGAMPNLSISGQMLSDMVYTVRSKTKAVLFFGSRLSAAKAHGHHTGNYPFHGLNDSTSQQEMNQELLEQFKNVRRKALAQLKARRTRSK